jgi:zinc protease
MKSSSFHSLPGPDDVTRKLLYNGMTILVRSNFNSPSVVVGGYLPAGSLFDPDEKLGLATFTASALMRGTEKRKFQQIFDALESVAANLSFNAGGHTTVFSGRCLTEDLPLLFELLADVLRKPAFPVEQVERLRAQFLTSLAIRAQDTAETASIAFNEIVFKDHPYSRPDDGWPETIQAITCDDLAKFHRNHFGPSGMVITVVGAIEPDDVTALVEKNLGDWENPTQVEAPTLPEYEPLKASVTRMISIPGKNQTDLVIGTSGPRRKDPEFLPASLGNSILGQFGMSGRIGEIVRVKNGLAYYVSSSLSSGIGPGTWDVSAGVNPLNVTKAIDLICKEIARFVKKGVSQEELSDSQSYFIGRLPLSLESNSGVAHALLNIERYDLGLDYLIRYPNLVQAITPEEVLVTVRHYLHPDKLAIAIAGS